MSLRLLPGETGVHSNLASSLRVSTEGGGSAEQQSVPAKPAVAAPAPAPKPVPAPLQDTFEPSAPSAATATIYTRTGMATTIGGDGNPKPTPSPAPSADVEHKIDSKHNPPNAQIQAAIDNLWAKDPQFRSELNAIVDKINGGTYTISYDPDNNGGGDFYDNRINIDPRNVQQLEATIAHEFQHAYDHLQGLSSDPSLPLLDQNGNPVKKPVDPSNGEPINPNAGMSPAELRGYVAAAVAADLTGTQWFGPDWLEYGQNMSLSDMSTFLKNNYGMSLKDIEADPSRFFDSKAGYSIMPGSPNAQVGGLIDSTLATMLGFTGSGIDLSKVQVNVNPQLATTVQQIDQILGALEDAIHGGNVNEDILEIAKALEARDPQGLANVASATKVYNDFLQIGKGPQQTLDGILSMGRDVLSWGQDPSKLSGASGALFNDLQRAQNDVDTGFAILQDGNQLLNGGDPIAAATSLGQDLHLTGEAAKDYYDVLNAIGGLSQINKGGFMNITEGSVKLGESVVSTNSAFGKWLHDNGEDVIGAAAAFEQILGGGGVLNQAQGALDLGEELVKLNVVSSNSALGSWLTQNGARFTGIIGGITSIIQGYEEGGVQGGVQAGIGADVLITSIGLSGGIATPVAIVVGILTIAFGGHHDNPATMPDKYDTDRYGQMVADMQGSMGANGQQFSEDPALTKLFGGRTGIQAVEETLAYYGTKDNAPGWLKPMWDQLAGMFGEDGQGRGHLSIGINGTGKDCNNQEVTGVADLDGKVYQYTDLGGLLYAFAAALGAATSGQGLAPSSGYTGSYPTLGGMDWHAVRTASGYGFYAEDQANPGNFYSYDPANNNLYYGTSYGSIGGTWIGDERTYDFTKRSAIAGQAPARPTYGGVTWHGFSLQGGGVAYWGSVTTTQQVTIDPPDPPADPVKGIKPAPLRPRTITETTTKYYFFGPDGVLYTGSGAGWLAKGSIVGNVATYDFTKGGTQTPPPAPAPVNPAPKPAPAPVSPAPLPVKRAPLPVRPPVQSPIVSPRTRFSALA